MIDDKLDRTEMIRVEALDMAVNALSKAQETLNSHKVVTMAKAFENFIIGRTEEKND